MRELEQSFWKYAKNYPGVASLDAVFFKWAYLHNLSVNIMNELWSHYIYKRALCVLGRDKKSDVHVEVSGPEEEVKGILQGNVSSNLGNTQEKETRKEESPVSDLTSEVEQALSKVEEKNTKENVNKKPEEENKSTSILRGELGKPEENTTEKNESKENTAEEGVLETPSTGMSYF